MGKVGKSVWLDEDVLDEIDDRSTADESPNQTLKRILLDEYGDAVVTREEVKEIAREEADDLINEYKNNY